MTSFDLIFSLFWEERDIKWKRKYLFTPVFNRDELQEINGVYLKWVK